jgi:hypothetical protein
VSDHQNFPLGDPRHPAWDAIKLAMWLGFLVGALAVMTNGFSVNDAKAVIATAAPFLATYTGHKLLKRRAWRKDDETSDE